MQLPAKKITIFILSDSTGATAEMVMNAALVQFNDLKPAFKRFSYVRSKRQIESVIAQARAADGIVIYSLVSADLRSWIQENNRAANVYTIDLLGPIIDRIRRQWNVVPRLKPGLLRSREEESLRLAEAVDFTINHDDGQGLETLGKANVILLGVSRTSKTPTSLYLSCTYGLKVANVPIIFGMKLPAKVLTLNTPKVGLTIGLERLAYLRKTRWKHTVEGYLDVTRIRQELDYAERMLAKIKGVKTIDVTFSSIEEVAARIMELREIPSQRAA